MLVIGQALTPASLVEATNGDIAGLGQDDWSDPAALMIRTSAAVLSIALIGGSFAFKNEDAKQIIRGIGMVVGGISLHMWVRSLMMRCTRRSNV